MTFQFTFQIHSLKPQHPLRLLLLLLPLLLLSLAHHGYADDQLACSQGTFCSTDSNGVTTLSVANNSMGSASASQMYLYGTFSVQMKMQSGYTGGTLLAFYLIDDTTESNKDPNHSEIDLELYGGQNSSTVMYTTNIFTGVKQNLVQMGLDYDPADGFHTYTIQWNAAFIAWYVDGAPFRLLSRDSDHPWPNRTMKPIVSLWDSSFFTALKANYDNGPVSVQLQGFSAGGCTFGDQEMVDPGSCPTWQNVSLPWNTPPSLELAQQTLQLRDQHLLNDYGWDNA